MPALGVGCAILRCGGSGADARILRGAVPARVAGNVAPPDVARCVALIPLDRSISRNRLVAIDWRAGSLCGQPCAAECRAYGTARAARQDGGLGVSKPVASSLARPAPASMGDFASDPRSHHARHPCGVRATAMTARSAALDLEADPFGELRSLPTR